MTPREARTALRNRAAILISEAVALQVLADELYPLTAEEKTERAIADDDEAFYKFLLRIYLTVKENSGITADEVAKSMGLPNNYPSEGSNYLTLQLLNHLEDMGIISSDRSQRTFKWHVDCDKDFEIFHSYSGWKFMSKKDAAILNAEMQQIAREELF